jgi:hypothetical protein
MSTLCLGFHSICVGMCQTHVRLVDEVMTEDSLTRLRGLLRTFFAGILRLRIPQARIPHTHFPTKKSM